MDDKLVRLLVKGGHGLEAAEVGAVAQLGLRIAAHVFALHGEVKPLVLLLLGALKGSGACVSP